jgi:hypothetical protein
VTALLRCASRLPARAASRWAIALPGPLDYERGIGPYEGVGKFHALRGCDLRAALRPHLPGVTSVSFHNDAHAFLLGEWWAVLPAETAVRSGSRWVPGWAPALRETATSCDTGQGFRPTDGSTCCGMRACRWRRRCLGALSGGPVPRHRARIQDSMYGRSRSAHGRATAPQSTSSPTRFAR